MSELRIGSMFSGVGGLDLAVEAFFDAQTAWHCEFDPEPSKVLAARWPGGAQGHARVHGRERHTDSMEDPMTRWLHSRRGVIEGEDLCSTC